MEEAFSELGAHSLFLRNLEISAVSEYYMALVWSDIINAEEQPFDIGIFSRMGAAPMRRARPSVTRLVLAHLLKKIGSICHIPDIPGADSRDLL